MMSGGISNQPKILRGAFVEYGLSLPPLFVVFQFNPETISRSLSATVKKPETPEADEAPGGSLSATADGGIRRGQLIEVNPETLSFELLLDATDKLNAGDALAGQFGVGPQLSTLELMMSPKNQSLMGGAAAALLGAAGGYAFGDEGKNPPVVLFIWGRKRVLPVNITGLQVTEQEFSTSLNPTRAAVSVSLEVIEGPNAPMRYTRALKEVMSLLNITNVTSLSNTMVPR